MLENTSHAPAPRISFQVDTQEIGSVFMGLTRIDPETDQSRAIVLVDATRLLELWRNDPSGKHADIALGNPQAWKSDYKYDQAAEGFSRGENDPVPLAKVRCRIEKNINRKAKRHYLFRREKDAPHHLIPYVSFIDGVAKTIWLMANGAKHFPVECHIEDAQALSRHAGVQANTSTITVQALTHILSSEK